MMAMKCCGKATYECQNLVINNMDDNRVIGIDRCLIPEIQSLWVRGIATLGCCCGHVGGKAYIQVAQKDSKQMVELGYEKQEPVMGSDGFLYGRDCFAPKTDCEKLRQESGLLV